MNIHRAKHLAICGNCDQAKLDGHFNVCTRDGFNVLQHADTIGCPDKKYPRLGCLDEQENLAAHYHAPFTGQQLIQGGIGIARAVTGFGGASPMLIRHRKSICEACPNAVRHPLGIRTCKICGCMLWAKIRNAAERCPSDYWLPVEEMPWFGHTGDFGDVIYSLPAVRSSLAREGHDRGGMYLFHDDRIGRNHQMTAARVKLIEPLLMLQPYLAAVEHVTIGEAVPHPLDEFRSHLDNCNLIAAHCRAVGVDQTYPTDAWLTVDQAIDTHVIFSRSGRYRNPQGDAMWATLMRLYAGKAIFVGVESEWRDFIDRFGVVPFARTDNLLELARLIAGCKLFCGNQSSPFAIAEGLKVPTILEVCPELPNCSFPRSDAIHLMYADDAYALDGGW